MTDDKLKFKFKQFQISQSKYVMKVGTDAVLLGAWVHTENATSILDVGTGTGVIAIMMAQKSKANIVALDIDSISVEQCKENVNNCPWSNRITVIHNSFQNFAATHNTRFDLIVSNPPYFERAYKSIEESRNQARHNDQFPFEDLIIGAKKLLNDSGRLCLILPTKESIKFRNLASLNNLFLTRITHIKTTLYKEEKRQLLQFELQSKSLLEDTLVIEQEERHCYSSEYKELTKEFYLLF